MRYALLLALALAGCSGEGGERVWQTQERKASEANSSCYRLETCIVQLGGRYGDAVEGLCVSGFDGKNVRTGEQHRFISREMLEAWSQLHPQAKPCE